MRPTNNTKTNNSNPKTTSNSKGCTQDQPEQSTCCSPDPETGSHDNIESHTKQNDGYTNDHSEPSPCCSAESEQTTCCSNEKNETAASSCCSTNTTETEQDACCQQESTFNHVTDNITIQPAPSTSQPKTEPQKLNQNTKTMAFKVKGMDCPSCASSVEKALTKIKNLSHVNINYATEKLQVSADGDLSISQIEKTVSNLGFTIEPLHQKSQHHHATYRVDGMDCGGCAKTIEKHLINISGVSDVQVNFSMGQMKVNHTVPSDHILREISKIGFDAELIDGKQTKPKKKTFNPIHSIITSGILITTGFIGSYTGIPEWLATLFFAAAIIISGYKPFKSAFYAVKSGSLDMNVLMSAAAIGAALIGEWFEGATVVWLFSFGLFLQDKSMEKTRRSIRDLMNIAPPEAWVSTPHGLVKKFVEDVVIEDIIVIKPGDKIPLDGKIIKGETSINQAPITGESIPVDKTPGDSVYAGTINENGALEVRVTTLAEDTTLAKIIHLVEEAQEQRAPTQAFIDKFSNIYTPIVFLIAISVIVFPPLLGFGVWSEWIYKGLALLVVACPCALVISTPVAIVSAIGNAAKHGVLIKGGNFLEAAGDIDAIAFDKTGTLTEGKPRVADVQAIHSSEKELLSIARTLESHSSHPIAQTIVAYAEDKGINIQPGEDYKNIAGKGVEAIINNEKHYAGNPKLFKELGSLSEKDQHTISSMQQEGKTIIIIGTEKVILGIISVMDTIRKTTEKSLETLPKLGIKQLVMLTGDNEGTAKLISEQTSVNRYFAELLPEDKVDALATLQQEGYSVAMVGDGINDAPALATSDLGIAMGATGTDTAMETADIVLMQDNLEKLPYTMRLSKRTIRIIKENIWFSLIIKFIALGLIFPGWLTLWMAVISDSGAAIIVILNALRLLRVKE